MALVPPDLIKNPGGTYALNIDKTWQIINGQELIGPPKTAAGKRVVPIPQFLGSSLDSYMKVLYECPDDERIFYGASKHFFAKEIERGCMASGVKRIRVYDLRHSHVSLLINLGYDALAIAQRIGTRTLSSCWKPTATCIRKRIQKWSKNLKNYADGIIVVSQTKK